MAYMHVGLIWTRNDFFLKIILKLETEENTIEDNSDISEKSSITVWRIQMPLFLVA